MKKTLKNIAKTLAIFIMLTSCASENLDTSIQDSSMVNAKKWFDASKPDLEVLDYTNTIDWNSAIVTNGIVGTVVEVPLILKENTNTNIGDDKSYKTNIRLMFIEDEKEKYKIYDVILTTNDTMFDNKNKNFNIYNVDNNYKGYVTLQNSKNVILDSKNYDKGQKIITPKKSNISAKWVCKYVIQVGTYRACKYEWVEDPYNVNSLPYDPQPTGVGNYIPIASGGSTSTSVESGKQIENQITPTNLDPCTSATLESLKQLTQADISNIFSKLGAMSAISIYKTTITTEVPINQTPAGTFRTTAYNYTIQISPDYTGKTKLYIASILLHEIVHAYFLSIVDDYNSNPNNQNIYNLNSFPSLFQAYCDKKYPPAPGTSQNIHHLEMASHYVDAISRSLQEYQTGISVPDNQTPQQIYNDLAWAGLNSTPVFDATFPIGNPSRQRILNRGACEQTGNPVGSGTPNEQTPIGQPCN